jgi:hypothetical protein
VAASPDPACDTLFAAFVIVHKRPGDKAALLLALRHLFFTTFTAPASVSAR